MDPKRLVKINSILQIILVVIVVGLSVGAILGPGYSLVFLLLTMPFIGLIQVAFGLIFLTRKFPRATFLKGYFAGVVLYFLGFFVILFTGAWGEQNEVFQYYIFPLPLLLTMAFWYHSYQVHQAVVKD